MRIRQGALNLYSIYKTTGTPPLQVEEMEAELPELKDSLDRELPLSLGYLHQARAGGDKEHARMDRLFPSSSQCQFRPQPSVLVLRAAAETRDWLSLSLSDIRQLFMDRGIDFDSPARDDELGRLLRLFAYALPQHIRVEGPGGWAATGGPPAAPRLAAFLDLCCAACAWGVMPRSCFPGCQGLCLCPAPHWRGQLLLRI